MPDIQDFEARHEREGVRPIWARVSGNGRLFMSRAAVLHVARLCGTAVVHSRTIAPLSIQFDPVWWVRHHQPRFAFEEHAHDDLRRGRIATEHSMFPATP